MNLDEFDAFIKQKKEEAEYKEAQAYFDRLTGKITHDFFLAIDNAEVNESISVFNTLHCDLFGSGLGCFISTKEKFFEDLTKLYEGDFFKDYGIERTHLQRLLDECPTKYFYFGFYDNPNNLQDSIEPLEKEKIKDCMKDHCDRYRLAHYQNTEFIQNFISKYLEKKMAEKNVYYHHSQLTAANRFLNGDSTELTPTNLCAFAVDFARSLANGAKLSDIANEVDSVEIFNVDKIKDTEASVLADQLPTIKATIVAAATEGRKVNQQVNADITLSYQQRREMSSFDVVAQQVLEAFPIECREAVKERQLSANLQAAYDFAEGKSNNITETQVRSYIKDFAYNRFSKDYDLTKLPDEIKNDPVLDGKKLTGTEAQGFADKMNTVQESLLKQITAVQRKALLIRNDVNRTPSQKFYELNKAFKNAVFAIGKTLLSEEALNKIKDARKEYYQTVNEKKAERNFESKQLRANALDNKECVFVKCLYQQDALRFALKAAGGVYCGENNKNFWKVPASELKNLADNVKEQDIYRSVADIALHKKMSESEKNELLGIKAQSTQQSQSHSMKL